MNFKFNNKLYSGVAYKSDADVELMQETCKAGLKGVITVFQQVPSMPEEVEKQMTDAEKNAMHSLAESSKVLIVTDKNDETHYVFHKDWLCWCHNDSRLCVIDEVNIQNAEMCTDLKSTNEALKTVGLGK